jgi:hypothetical protein
VLRKGHEYEVNEGHQFSDCLTDFSRVFFDLVVEESLTEDLQRGAHHLFAQVDGFANAPAAARLTGIFANYLGVACKSFAMKRGLDQPALSSVQRVFASQKAVTHHGAASLHDRPAYLPGTIDDEELLD